MLTYGQKLIAEAIEAHFGERIENYDEDADDTCIRDAWEAFDALTALSEQPAPDHAGLVERLENARGLLSFDGYSNAAKAVAEAIAALSRVQEPVAAPFVFRRFVDGVEMAEDVEIHNASTVEEAFCKARALYGKPKGMDLLLTATPPAQGDAAQPAAEGAWLRSLEPLLKQCAAEGPCTSAAGDKLRELRRILASPAASQEGGEDVR